MSDNFAKELTVLLFTDMVGSVDLQKRLGTAAYTRAVAKHDALLKAAFAQSRQPPIILKETGDGVLAKFATASDAVGAALRIQYLFGREESWDGEPVGVRIGLHLGEVIEMAEEITGETRAVGMAINLTARVMDLALANQILMTRSVFDDARQFIAEHPAVGLAEGAALPALQWPAHGRYLFKGYDEPLEIFEAGTEGIAPLVAPEGNEKAKRAVTAEEEATLGWRPGAGLAIPRREDWVVERKVGAGGFGEVWLAKHRITKEDRVFKFCFDPERLRSFKRELTLFRLLRDALGKRKDIAALYEVSVEAPPYYLESEFVPTGNLAQWAESQGGIENVPMGTRLELLVRCARAAAAAHSVGVIHKDIKPSNVLIAVEDGSPRPRLADFGIGSLATSARLEEFGITEVGFTESILMESESSRTGTRLYSAPEYLVGGAPSVLGDVYSLGVMLYQLVAGDLKKPLGSGWRRDIEDDLLSEDIARAIDVDPARRFETAQELAEHIETLEARRQEVELERARVRQVARRRRLLGLAGVGMIGLAVLASFFAYAFVQQREREKEARTFAAQQLELKKEARATASDLDVLLAGQLLERDKAAAAVAHLARAVRNNPENLAAARKLMATLAMRNFVPPERERIEIGGPGDRTVGFAVDVSPDGTRVAAAYESGTKVRIWDLGSGEPVTEVLSPGESEGEKGAVVLQLAFAENGERLVTNTGKAVRIWDAGTGNLLREETSEIGGLISRDGSRWLRQTPTALEIWDLGQGTVMHRNLPLFEAAAREIAFAPNGRWILALGLRRERGALTRKLLLLDLADQGEQGWTELSSQSGFNNNRLQLYLSPDYSRVALAGLSGLAEVWSLPDGKQLNALPKPGDEILTLAFSPDSRKLVAGYFGNTAHIWDIESGRTIGAPLRHDGGVIAAQVTPDGAKVVTGSLDGTARVWDLAGGVALTEPLQLTGPPLNFKFIDGGRGMVVTAFDGTAWVWNLLGREALGTPLAGLEQKIGAIAPDGETLAELQTYNVVRVIRRGSATPLVPPIVHKAAVQRVQFSSDGRFLTTFSPNEAKWTDLAKGHTVTRILDGPRGQARAIGPSGRIVATVPGRAGASEVWLWDLADPSAEPARLAHRSPPLEIAMSEGAQRVAVTTRAGGYLWERNSTGDYEFRELPHLTYALSITFSSDGAQILIGKVDDSAQVWDFATAEPVSTSLTHTGPVVATAFSPGSGPTLAATLSATFDKLGHFSAIRIWDLATDEPLAPPIKLKGSAGPQLQEELGNLTIGFNQDSSGVFLHGAGEITSWDLAPNVEGAAPLWICELGEAVAGLKLDRKGKPQPVPFAEYLRVREEVRTRVGDTELDRWAKWLIADRSSRTISPSSEMSSLAYVDHQIHRNTVSSLREALHISPGHPTVMAMLGGRLIETNDEASDATWLLDRAITYFSQPLVRGAHGPQMPRQQRALGLTALSEACRILGDTDKVGLRPANGKERRGHLEGAVKFAAEAIASGEEVPPQAAIALSQALTCLGEFVEKEGDPEAARDHYVAATIATQLGERLEPTLGIAQTTPASFSQPGHQAFMKLVQTRVPEVATSEAKPLLGRDSTWKYLDDGSDQGVAWREVKFNDEAWRSGLAPLGYGRDGEVTKIDPGEDPDQRPLTVYFRSHFSVEDPATIENLQVRLRCDDGAAVYLNGEEVLRENLPPGELSSQTAAATAITGERESRFVEHVIDLPEALVAGENVIAVEVHQSGPESSDLAFELELRANIPDSRRYLRELEVSEAETSLERLKDLLPAALRQRLSERVGPLRK